MKDQNVPALITVIIPTRNEGIYIDRCLRSVFSADAVSGGMEILVVDGMSTDDTRTILQEWCRREQRLKLLDNPSGIVPSAMNIGIRASRGEWIIRLDAHSEYPTDYFTRCLRVSQATLADNVGGSVVSVGLDETLQGRIVRALRPTGLEWETVHRELKMLKVGRTPFPSAVIDEASLNTSAFMMRDSCEIRITN